MTQEYGKCLTMALISKANDKGTNLRTSARAVGINEATATDWIRAKAIPTDDDIAKLCEYLECTAAEVKRMADAQFKKMNGTDYVEETTTTAPVKNTNVPKETPKPVEKTKDSPKPEAKQSTTKTDPKKEENPAENFSLPEPIVDESEPKEATKTKAPVEPKATQPAKATEEAKPKKAKTPKTASGAGKTPAPTAKKNELVLPEDMDTFVRKNAGLKKSDVVSKADVVGVFNNTASEVKERLSELSRLEQSITEALYSSLADDKVEPRLEKLVATARKATDEGLDLAITILEKFAK